MADPFAGWTLAPAQAPDVSGWKLTPVTPPTVGNGEVAGRGAVQGATLGLGDELNAAMQVLPNWLKATTPLGMAANAGEALAEVTSDVPESQRAGAAKVDAERAASEGLGGQLRRKVEEYRLNRDADRAGNKRAKEANPLLYGATEIASSIPASFLLPGAQAKGVAGLAKAGAVSGGVAGLGGSQADLTQGDVLGALKDTALGATLGAGVGAAAGGLGKLAGRATEGIRKATADAGKMANDTAQKALRTARSSLGGEVAAAFQAIGKAEEIAANAAGRYTPEQVAAAQAWLASPEVQGLAQNAADNLLAAGPGRVAGSMQTARNVLTEAQQNATPQAVEAASEKLLANPITNQVLPRLKNYASRAIPPVVGAAVGGPGGALMGFGAGAVMGNPGTALANMLKHPSTRKMGYELLRLLGKGGETVVQRGGGAAERALLNEAMQEND